jgi:hypothetical protein
MRAQPRRDCPAKDRDIDAPVLDCGEERERGVGPLQQLLEDRRGFRFRERRDQRGVDLRAGNISERCDQRRESSGDEPDREQCGDFAERVGRGNAVTSTTPPRIGPGVRAA